LSPSAPLRLSSSCSEEWARWREKTRIALTNLCDAIKEVE
jgi:hypothetical protein